MTINLNFLVKLYESTWFTRIHLTPITTIQKSISKFRNCMPRLIFNFVYFYRPGAGALDAICQRKTQTIPTCSKNRIDLNGEIVTREKRLQSKWMNPRGLCVVTGRLVDVSRTTSTYETYCLINYNI